MRQVQILPSIGEMARAGHFVWRSMKIKDRLALEYSETVHEAWNARLESKKAYLTGFNACKELLLKREYLCVPDRAQTELIGERDDEV